jgi:hypothetical protein
MCTICCRFFHLHNPSGRTMALGLTQPRTEMSIRIFPGDKDGRRVRLTTLPPSYADCLEIWEPQLPGTLRACPGLQWDCFTICFSTKNLHSVHRVQPRVLYTSHINSHDQTTGLLNEQTVRYELKFDVSYR